VPITVFPPRPSLSSHRTHHCLPTAPIVPLTVSSGTIAHIRLTSINVNQRPSLSSHCAHRPPNPPLWSHQAQLGLVPLVAVVLPPACRFHQSRHLLTDTCTACHVIALVLELLSIFSISADSGRRPQMPSTGLSSGVKIQYGSRCQAARRSVTVKLNKTAMQLLKERQNRYDQLAGGF